LNQQLHDIEQELSLVQQAPPHLIDHAKEQNLTHLHNQILDKLTDYYRQLSKKHWATKGDRNTKFFQQACTRRRQKNRIMFIRNGPNSIISNPQDIAEEFIHYFTSLFTSSSHVHNLDFSRTGTIANDFTNSIPNIDECLQIIKSMRMNAALQPLDQMG
jgi:hypothetical protein